MSKLTFVRVQFRFDFVFFVILILYVKHFDIFVRTEGIILLFNLGRCEIMKITGCKSSTFAFDHAV